MSAHALLSPSSSERWLNCTPSIRLSETLPEIRRASNGLDFAAQGTEAHRLGEAKLRLAYNQITQEEYDVEYESIKNGIYWSEEFENDVDGYVVYVRSQVGSGDTILIEQRVDYSMYVPEGHGSADIIILNDHSILVIDLKYGLKYVDATGNSQLRLYAVGAVLKYQEQYPDIKTVTYTIYQPRANNISSETVSKAKLIDWVNTVVKPKAKLAYIGAGEFMAGTWCQYCKAKPMCKTRAEQVAELAKIDFRPVQLMTHEAVSTLVDKAQGIVTWVSDAQDYLLEEAVNKGKIPKGYKLSTTVTHRKITDPLLASVILNNKGLLKEELFEPAKLKSIAQLEKLGSKGQVVTWLGSLIARPEGQPKLVKDNHSAEKDFS